MRHNDLETVSTTLAHRMATEQADLPCVEWLEQALVPPLKPSTLQIAELDYVAARNNRRNASKLAGVVTARDLNDGANRPRTIAERFISEVDLHDEAVKAARIALEAQRSEYEQNYLAHLGPAIRASEYALTEIIDHLDAVAGALADANTYAESNDLRAPPLISSALRLQCLVSELRDTLSTSR